MAEITPVKRHAPVARHYGTDRFVYDCLCGYQQEGLYVTEFGARTAYLEHVIQDIAARAGWDDHVHALVEA